MHTITADAASGYRVLWWGHIGVLVAPRGKTWEKQYPPLNTTGRKSTPATPTNKPGRTTSCFIVANVINDGLISWTCVHSHAGLRTWTWKMFSHYDTQRRHRFRTLTLNTWFITSFRTAVWCDITQPCRFLKRQQIEALCHLHRQAATKYSGIFRLLIYAIEQQLVITHILPESCSGIYVPPLIQCQRLHAVWTQEMSDLSICLPSATFLTVCFSYSLYLVTSRQ